MDLIVTNSIYPDVLPMLYEVKVRVLYFQFGPMKSLESCVPLTGLGNKITSIKTTSKPHVFMHDVLVNRRLIRCSEVQKL